MKCDSKMVKFMRSRRHSDRDFKEKILSDSNWKKKENYRSLWIQ